MNKFEGGVDIVRFQVPLGLDPVKPELFTFKEILKSADIASLPIIRIPVSKSMSSTQTGFNVFTKKQDTLF